MANPQCGGGDCAESPVVAVTVQQRISPIHVQQYSILFCGGCWQYWEYRDGQHKIPGRTIQVITLYGGNQGGEQAGMDGDFPLRC